jgi:uncharacterized paraquat-inducible protein A
MRPADQRQHESRRGGAAVSEPDKDHCDDYEPAELVKCPRCDGLGEIDPGDGREEAECPECQGEGRVEW